MENKLNSVSQCEMELEAKYSYEELKDEFEEALKKEAAKISIPGFRKGKVPMSMIKKMYGNSIEYQACEDIANKKFWEIIKEKNLIPISTPALTELDFADDKSLNFKVKFEIKPTLENLKYKDFEIEKPIFKLKEEEVEREIDYMLKPHLTYQEHDLIKGKDFRIVTNLQRIDENKVAMIGHRSENINIDLSSENINPQIINNTLNKKVGDKFLFDFTQDDEKDGQKVKEDFHYEGEITKIEKIVYPELTDEFVKKISKDKANNLVELKEQIRTHIQNYLNDQSDKIYINSLLNKIVEENEFKVPEGFTKHLLDKIIEDDKNKAKQKGIKEKDYDENKEREHYQERAVWEAKWSIIFENISEQENIKVTDEDLSNLAKEDSEKTNIPIEKLINYYKNTNRKDSLLEEKVISFLKENNKVKEVDPEKIKKEKRTKNEK
ncbi:MAG: trigger factor [Ignavibacteriales bacterium]|nr:trigger factor [Ignavibacteriales bacterium]